VSGASKRSPDSRELAGWLAKDGQLLFPLVELLEKGERAIDEVLDVMGRATIEAILQMSAVQKVDETGSPPLAKFNSERDNPCPQLQRVHLVRRCAEVLLQIRASTQLTWRTMRFSSCPVQVAA